jgi:hypothetical protein
MKRRNKNRRLPIVMRSRNVIVTRIPDKSRAIIRDAGMGGRFTQQYRTQLRRELQDPATTVERMKEIVQEVQAYAKLGGRVSDIVR